jgi:hypothetical protein
MEMFPTQILALYWGFQDGDYTSLCIYEADVWTRVSPTSSSDNLASRTAFKPLRLRGYFCLETASLAEMIMGTWGSTSRQIEFPLQSIQQLFDFDFILSYYRCVCEPFSLHENMVELTMHPKTALLREHLEEGWTARERQSRPRKERREEKIEFVTMLFRRCSDKLIQPAVETM